MIATFGSSADMIATWGGKAKKASFGSKSMGRGDGMGRDFGRDFGGKMAWNSSVLLLQRSSEIAIPIDGAPFLTEGGNVVAQLHLLGTLLFDI